MENAMAAALLSHSAEVLAWDVTVCTTVAVSYVTAASRAAGDVAWQAPERSTKYAEFSAVDQFQPVAFSHMGHWAAVYWQTWAATFLKVLEITLQYFSFFCQESLHYFNVSIQFY